MNNPSISIFLHHPPTFSARSGFPALIELLGTTPIYYNITWEEWQKTSWTVGQYLRRFGQKYYGSAWNALVPIWDDIRLYRQFTRASSNIAHFLWAEFARPKWPAFYRRKGARLIGSFHASARRQPSVLAGIKEFNMFDWVTTVSKSQVPFFIERGFDEKRIRVLPLGIDADHFIPGADFECRPDQPLRCLMVGYTERDHEFLVSVFRRVSPKLAHLYVRAAKDQEQYYKNIPSVTILPYLSDDALLREYRIADLLVMPMLDCTANDAVLEAMACGTPVLTNLVGGIPEYVSDEACFITDDKNADVWVDRIHDFARNRENLLNRRAAVREWAERFDWKCIVPLYRKLYEDALGLS